MGSTASAAESLSARKPNKKLLNGRNNLQPQFMRKISGVWWDVQQEEVCTCSDLPSQYSRCAGLLLVSDRWPAGRPLFIKTYLTQKRHKALSHNHSWTTVMYMRSQMLKSRQIKTSSRAHKPRKVTWGVILWTSGGLCTSRADYETNNSSVYLWCHPWISCLHFKKDENKNVDVISTLTQTDLGLSRTFSFIFACMFLLRVFS